MAKPATRRGKNQPSTIDRLPKSVRETINRLRTDCGWTIDELLEKLDQLGHDEISRSALGRHVRTLAEVNEQLAATREYAEAIAKEAGDEDEGKMLSVNAQLLQANMLRLMMAQQEGEPVQLSPKEAKDFADALRSIALTRKTEVDVIAKAREEERKLATVAAADKAVKAAHKKGLSREVVDGIRHAVLGSDG